MAKLTVAVDDDVLRRARMRARDRGTSVHAVVREHLESYADGDATRAAMRRFLRITSSTASSSAPQGRTWTRDEVHDRFRS